MTRLRIAVPLFWLLFLAKSTSALGADCFDVSVGEPKQLNGQLSLQILPGPPGYEDVQAGDAPQPTYILKLAEPICITGDDYANPNAQFDEVHLVGSEDTDGPLRASIGTEVTVTLADPMGAHTGHDKRPLVAWVTALEPSADPAPDHGTAATTIRAFYLALNYGDGDQAARFVVPEKRGRGNFNGAKITAFYGSLKEPIELIELRPQATGEYYVRYRYSGEGLACESQAIISTRSINGQSYIQRIQPLDGC